MMLSFLAGLHRTTSESQQQPTEAAQQLILFADLVGSALFYVAALIPLIIPVPPAPQPESTTKPG